MTQITNTSLRSILTLAFVCIFPLLTQAQSPYRSRNIHLGVSGSNVQDSTNASCCGGTLGSLVTNGTSNYILSNNHVLARRDKAAPGEDISQPGLIDNGCRAATIVADFTAAPRLGSNVDAAIAQLRNGLMDTSGFIEGIGTISSVVAAPSIGLPVAKSGRTTGTTTGTIASLNTSVYVQYQDRCGRGRSIRLSSMAAALAQAVTQDLSLSPAVAVISRWDFFLQEAVRPHSPIPSARFSARLDLRSASLSDL